jgi:TIR domain/Pentapeptide repeats (8 copies)
MANQEHLEILKKGMDGWNQWRHENPDVILDLGEANLRSADLSGFDLSGAHMRRADLREANLRDAYLGGADLAGADLTLSDVRGGDLHKASFRWAVLIGANLTGVSLYEADFTGATLCRTVLSGAELAGVEFLDADLGSAVATGAMMAGTRFLRTQVAGADFSQSMMQGTFLLGVDLRGVTGLESVKHAGPSMIDIDTIFRSKGTIPESFLRGAGVPEHFVQYMRSLVGIAIEYYSCFISYSSKDEEFAQRLYADLHRKGVRCWFAPHDVQSGRKLHEQIDQAIRVHERLLLILSEHSMNSEWVKTEIAKARKREVEQKKRVLFPLRLVSFEAIRDWECFDADTGKDSAREIREYFIPDFSDWKKHDEYQKAFERLMKDLKAGERSSG